MSNSVDILRKEAPASLEELAQRLKEPLDRAGAERAIAFGSYARGEANGYSDLDLVVALDTELPFLERGRLLPEVLEAVPVGVDLLIYTPDELRRGMEQKQGIFAEIADHGVTVYARDHDHARP